MTRVRAVNITKRYEAVAAVNRINLEAEDGKFVTLLGPSGCGKSTTLKIIAGLIYPDEGEIYFDDRNVTELPPNKRNIGFVFQRIALFPHMNVHKNIAFGLRMKHRPKEEINRKIKEVLYIVHMEGFEKRMPSQLSGGQAQRIEIARVLATDPDTLLFDEPLSNIDAKLRDELKYEIRRIQRETGKTMIYVTHDQAEAFAISDKIYVMNNGSIEQIGTPVELYVNPVTPFVASFIGSNNFLKGRILDLNPSMKVARVSSGEMEIRAPYSNGLRVNDQVLVCIRPEDISVVGEAERSKYSNVVQGKIDESVFAGLLTRLNVNVKGIILKIDVQGSDRFSYLNAKGKEVLLGFNKCSLIAGATEIPA